MIGVDGMVEMLVKVVEMEWKKRRHFPNLFSFFSLLIISLFFLHFLLPFSFLFYACYHVLIKNLHSSGHIVYKLNL